MKKKLLASVLALSLALGLCTSASAADEVITKSGETKITITSVLNLPTIKVTIGSPTNVIVNPYKMDYNVSDSSSIEEKQIISAASTITNESGIKVSISATPTLKTTSNDLKILTSAPTDESIKALYLAFNMAVTADPTNYTGAESGTVTAPVVKAGDSTMTPTTVEIQLGRGDTTATTGAYIFTGACSGEGWTAADQITDLTIAFNISPVLGTGT